jgi:serine/threonine protein kinase
MLLCGKVILLLFYIDIGKYSMSKTVSNMLLADKYTLGDCLGEGTFASVSEAVNTKTNQRAAIKQIFIQAHFIDQAVDEVEKASMVKSDHVVKLYEYFYDPS